MDLIANVPEGSELPCQKTLKIAMVEILINSSATNGTVCIFPFFTAL
jgi:hypothetical protein